jgi:membrane associated rhomboid family serine protease
MNLISIIRKPFPYKRYNLTLALIVINVGIFLITQIYRPVVGYLALIPHAVFERGYFWQLFTYMFVHADISHIIFNMLGLWMFGTTLEDRLGSVEFLLYYLFCGILTGVVLLLFNNTVVGASGAIFGILLAFAAFFPEARLLFFFVIPMKAPMAVLIFAGLELFFLVTGTMAGISHLGHLAGIVFGFLYLLVRLNVNPIKIFFGRNIRRY